VHHLEGKRGKLGRDAPLNWEKVCDERPSHPQDIMGTPKYWMEEWKSKWDELGRVGCTSGRETFPGPLVPELIA